MGPYGADVEVAFFTSLPESTGLGAFGAEAALSVSGDEVVPRTAGHGPGTPVVRETAPLLHQYVETVLTTIEEKQSCGSILSPVPVTLFAGDPAACGHTLDRSVIGAFHKRRLKESCRGREYTHGVQ